MARTETNTHRMKILMVMVFIGSFNCHGFHSANGPFKRLSSGFICPHNQSNGHYGPSAGSDVCQNRLEFALYSKNPSFDRKRREQRRSRRLKQVLPKEEEAIEHDMNALFGMTKQHQKKTFGFRLSELPGDGGIVPFIDSCEDKEACLRRYYADYRGKDLEYVQATLNDRQSLDALCRNPEEPIGRFKDEKPLVHQCFYHPFEGVFDEEEYVQATHKKTIASIRQHHVESFKGTQNYYGLEVETLFRFLDPEDMEYLRQMEIRLKRGHFERGFFTSNYDKLTRSGTKSPKFAIPEDSQEPPPPTDSGQS